MNKSSGSAPFGDQKTLGVSISSTAVQGGMALGRIPGGIITMPTEPAPLPEPEPQKPKKRPASSKKSAKAPPQESSPQKDVSPEGISTEGKEPGVRGEIVLTPPAETETVEHILHLCSDGGLRGAILAGEILGPPRCLAPRGPFSRRR